MESGLQEAAYLCATVQRITAVVLARQAHNPTQTQTLSQTPFIPWSRLQNQSQSASSPVLRPAKGGSTEGKCSFAEESHLLCVVHFIRHLDLLRQHQQEQWQALLLAAVEEEEREEKWGEDDYDNKQSEHAVLPPPDSAEGVDFIPCQLRLLGPVEVARCVLRACPRAYRTSFEHVWPSADTGMTLMDGEEEETEDEEYEEEARARTRERVVSDNFSEDDPLHGLLTRREDPATRPRYQEEEEKEQRRAFIASESNKIFPMNTTCASPGAGGVSGRHLHHLHNDQYHAVGEGDEEEEDEDDALLQQYYRSQSSFGPVFVHLMLGLPTPGTDTAREIETAIYAEVTAMLCRVGVL